MYPNIYTKRELNTENVFEIATYSERDDFYCNFSVSFFSVF